MGILHILKEIIKVDAKSVSDLQILIKLLMYFFRVLVILKEKILVSGFAFLLMFVFPSLISVHTTDKYIGKNIQSGQIGRKVQIQKCFSSLTGGLEVSHIHAQLFLSTLNLTCGL